MCQGPVSLPSFKMTVIPDTTSKAIPEGTHSVRSNVAGSSAKLAISGTIYCSSLQALHNLDSMQFCEQSN